MPFAVEMYMDSDTEARVRHIWTQFASAGVKSSMLDAGYRPHISLGVCEELDVEGLGHRLSVFAKASAPFALTLSSIGLFPQAGVIFLSAVVTRRLLDVHAAFHSFFGEYAKAMREHYLADAWIPHCTLAFDLPSGVMPKAIEICLGERLPVYSRVEEIGIAEVSPSRAEILWVYRLIS